MGNTEGLIQYYFQRRISGMDPAEIQNSLHEQQHIEEEDREEIIREVERRQKNYLRQLAHQRISRLLYFCSLPLLLISAVLLYLSVTGLISYSYLIALVILILSVIGIGSAFYYSRSAS